jgi:nucleoside-diphosphate-sugar epimerase
MKKILIVGKKSFIGSHLYDYLKNFFYVKIISFKDLNNKNINHFDYIINCSIHPNYVRYKYNKIFDVDLKITKKILEGSTKYIFLNTRKIYKQKFNIKENSYLNPIDNYAKNKIKTEKILLKTIKNRLISLRISNILGKRKFLRSRRCHNLFLDNFIKYRKNGKIIEFKDCYKDFITIDYFNKVIEKIIKKKITGIYNLSLGEKVYLSEIITWLDIKFSKNVKFNSKKDEENSFTLNNKKLVKKIKISISKNQVMNFCRKIFK